VNWGQTSDSQLYKTALSAAYKLNLKSDHVKSYRPSILLLSGVPNNRLPLISLANEITKHRGMLIVCDIVNNNLIYEIRVKTIELWNNWLNKKKIKGFYTLLNSDSISEGSKMLIQVCFFSEILYKLSFIFFIYIELWFRNYSKTKYSDDWIQGVVETFKL
jgi:solute carrier family 12 sodium/potassium/chloride transporter 2